MKIADLLRDVTFPDEDRHWLVPVLAGAMMAGIFWIAIDRTIQLDQPGGFFAPLRWSVTSLLICVAIGSAVGLVAGWIERTWRRRHSEGVRTVAQQLGFSYSPNAELLRSLGSVFPMMRNWHRSEHLISGERDGVNVDVFDLTQVWYDVEGRSKTHTTIVVLAADGLPEFDIVPRSFLMRGKWAGLRFQAEDEITESASQAVQDFTRRYVVYCGYTGEVGLGPQPESTPKAEQAIRLLLTPSAMQELVPLAGWWIESRDGRLGLSRGRGFCPPTERPAMLDEALAIRSIFMQHATKGHVEGK
jgi:hypothetical protein